MHRFEVLAKEINKRIQVDEKSGHKINDWSPNNLRRLVIGWNYALLQFHTTGGKFPKLMELVSLQSASQKDLELLQKDYNKYKPILKVLTAGRVCSHIEEIVFDTDGYDGQMFVLDRDLDKSLGQSTDSRFPRLTSISFVESDMRTMGRLLQSSVKPNDLLLDAIRNEQMSVTPLHLTQKYADGTWKLGRSLRKYIYVFDGTLESLFDKQREQYEQDKRQQELNRANMQKSLSLYNKQLKPPLTLVSTIKKNFEVLNAVFEKASFISKSEWASYFSQQNMYKGIGKEFRLFHKNREDINARKPSNEREDSLLTLLRRVDFEELVKFLESVEQGVFISHLRYIETLIFDGILASEEQYKRDSNKLNLQESISALSRGITFLYDTQLSLVFLGFTSFLSRNTPRYTLDFYNKLEVKPEDVVFTRTQIAFCNRYMPTSKNGHAKESLGMIGATEVLVEQYDLRTKHKVLTEIVKALSSL